MLQITLDNKTRAWNRYSEYCRSIGLGDNLFLEDMSKTHRIEIIGGFAVAVHQGRFSRPRDAPLAESTVSDTLNHVAAIFRENGHDDPKRDAERNVAQLLRHLIQKKYNRKLFLFAFSASSFSQNPQNFVKQWANSQEPPTSG